MSTLTALPTLERPSKMEADPLDASRSLDDAQEENRRWVLGLRASDERVMESFFRALHPALVRYAERFVHVDLANDIVQESFVKIWGAREQLDPERSLKAFAYRTVRNLALNRVRDRTRRGELLELHPPETSSPPAADASTLQSELEERMSAWIGELPDRQREALTLSRMSGMTHQEVAEAMGLSARTVNNHLVRALRSLRARVEAYDPSLLST